ASYDYLSFQEGQDRLSLDYSTLTTLNAVLTPRLTLDINHNTRYQPRGEYNEAQDGLRYFSPADESRNYLLSARIAYTPVQALTFSRTPTSQKSARGPRTAEGTVPSSRQRSLNFSGGASLNLKVGNRGRLTGTIARVFNSSQNTSYAAGAVATPTSEIDYW